MHDQFQWINNFQFFAKLTMLPFVEIIWIYGSRARHDSQERSDIDLAILCPTASTKEWLDVLKIIDEADTLLKIDCLRFDELQEDSPLKKAILSQGVKLYAKEKL